MFETRSASLRAPTPLTPQQAEAVRAREVSVVLSSGAGCGKTHVLTERYLSHLRDDEAEVGQVVAITYTERAARQMRERIRAALRREVVDAATDEQAEHWARHLRGLEAAQICTIHAFAAALLRQNAVEAGVDPRFDVLEDVLAVNLEQEALAACLQRLLIAPSREGDDLQRLVREYGWRPVVEAVQELVRTRDVPAWNVWLGKSPVQIASEWCDRACNVVQPTYVHHVIATNTKIARCQRLLQQTPPKAGSPISANAAFILETVPRLGAATDLPATLGQLKEAAKVGKEREKAWSSKEVYEEIKEAFSEFREEVRGLSARLFPEVPADLAVAAEIGQCFVRVANEAARSYRERKRRDGVLDFHDLLVEARDLLRDWPEVRARLQQRYRYLLIDELQDTDPVQMELVELLCGGGLTAGTLFAVGDHKQSIYRFRGADVQLFRQLRQQMPHAGRLGLTRNFRSQPAILDFANALLGHRLEDFEPLEPHLTQVNPGPCTEFLWTPRGDKESVTEARTREARTIARRIAAMVHGEALVAERPGGTAQLRAVRPGDIVLLFRAMTSAHLYEAALREQSLDYYLVGGRAFFAQQEIYDLLNLLRALENPRDAISLTGTLRSPFCCLSDEALFVLTRHEDGLWAGLHDPACHARLPRDQQETAARAGRYLDRWRTLKDRLPIARLLGEVFADSGYDAAMQFEFLGDRKLANLWKLQELARAFDRSGLFGLADFIQRLGDLVRLQPREEQAATQPERADVVRLMSIHQAKGLEFPVVFLPDLVYKAGGSFLPVAVWTSRLGCVCRPPKDEEAEPPFPDFAWKLGRLTEEMEEWQEELRTLYVACTRAQDYLVLSGALPEPFAPTNAWTLVLAERFDPRSGACLASDIPTERVPGVRVMEFSAFPEEHTPERTERREGRARLSAEDEAAALHPIPVQNVRNDRSWPQFDAEDGSDANSW